jgi:hypothetical protein
MAMIDQRLPAKDLHPWAIDYYTYSSFIITHYTHAAIRKH